MSGTVTSQNARIIGLWYRVRGSIPPADYGKIIAFPPGTNRIVKFLWSEDGGNCVWEDLYGNVNQQTFQPTIQYPIYDVSRILTSGTDWQGNAAINTITDLQFAGE